MNMYAAETIVHERMREMRTAVATEQRLHRERSPRTNPPFASLLLRLRTAAPRRRPRTSGGSD